MFSSAAVASIAANFVSLLVLILIHHLVISSAAVDVTAVLPKVSPPSGITTLLPDCAVKVLAVN